MLRAARRGFTLIELLMVVAIIGVLAAVAIPKFANTKEKGYIASEKADLRNMVSAEEAYFADYLTYTSAGSLIALGRANLSAGVSLVDGTPDGAGWSATASQVGTSHTCSIWVGPGHQFGTTLEGSPICY